MGVLSPLNSDENIPDNFFDIINLSSVIEHLEHPSKNLILLKQLVSIKSMSCIVVSDF